MKKISILLSFLAASLDLSAQAGALDSTFSGNGMIQSDISVGGNDGAYAAVQQADGKIVYGGFSYDGSQINCFLQRVNEDGSIDSTYGNNGTSLFDIGLGADDRIYDLAIQADGKVVAVGMVSDGVDADALIMRIDMSGALDTSFGNGGVVKLDPSIGEDEQANAVAIRDDGKIFIAGFDEFMGKKNMMVARLLADGTPDPTFNVFGSVSYDVHGEDDIFEGVAVAPDGKVVAAGSTDDGQSINVVVVRLDSAGQLDSTFSTDGKFSADLQFGETDHAMDVAVYSNGKVIVSGFVIPGGQSDAFVFRLNSNGIFDNTFGSSGRTTFDVSIGDTDRLSQVSLLPDNKILVGGYTNLGTSANDFLLMRLLSNGDPDTTFNHTGWATYDAGGTTTDGMRGMGIQGTDGKYLICGFSSGKAVLMRVIDDVDAPASLNAATGAQEIKAWPVPFSNELNIALPASLSGGATWHLVNAEGRTVAMGNFDAGMAGHQVQLSFEQASLPAGVYLLRLESQGKVWMNKISCVAH